VGKEIAKLRDALIERCKGYCEACGKPMTDNWALHHRKLRSQGGDNSLSNLMAVHHDCHNLGTKSIHLNPEWAKKNGYIVSSWGNSAEIPILWQGKVIVLFKDDGTVHHPTGRS